MLGNREATTRPETTGELTQIMLTWGPDRVNEHATQEAAVSTCRGACLDVKGRTAVAEIKIEDGIIKVVQLDIQDPRSAEALAEYPEPRWAEITRRAIKIGLGVLKGGARD